MKMPKKTLIAFAAALATLGAQPVLAQSSAELEELRAQIRALRAELEQMKKTAPATAPAAAPAAAAPAALNDRVEQLEIKSKDAVVAGDIPGSFRLPGSDTSVRIYGYAEAHAIHDFKGTAPSDNFTNLMEQPLELRDAGYGTGRTKMTAETSRFGFETSTPTAHGLFNTKVEGDFYAYCGSECNRYRFRLRHAYGEYAGFLIGQTWSTFMDLDDLPETVDFNGPIGNPFSRRMMVRYTYGDPKAGYKLTFAAEDPESGARMPNLVARYDHSFTWGAINVRGLYHEKRVGTESKYGTGFGVGGNFKLTPDDLLMGQWARVEGDFDMMYGSNGYTTDASGNILFDKNDGLVLGWAHTFNAKLRSNVAFGMNRSHTEVGFDNKTLQQLHLGFIYSPLKNVELGAEYIYGLRKTWDQDKGTMSRLDLMGRFSF